MVDIDFLEARLRDAVSSLPDGLRGHVLRVEAEARRLAELHNVDEHRSVVAALGHDLVRHLNAGELLAAATEYGHVVDPVEAQSPILVHGPVAARILSLDFGLEDTELLDGIDCHTTARAGMTALERVLFIADKVEPHKLKREPSLGEVKDTAEEDLLAATLLYLDYNLGQSVKRGWLVHPRSLEARNELLTLRGLPA